MKNLFYIIALGISLCSTVNAQRIYHTAENTDGTKDVVSVMVPEGWAPVFSKNIGVAAKQLLVKADETNQTVNNGMIFIQSVPVESFLPSSDNLVEHEKMMYSTAGVNVKETLRWATSDNTQVRVITVTGSVDGKYQVIAYLPLKNGMVSATLCTPYLTFLNDHIKDLETLVKSYQVNPHLVTPAVPVVVDLTEK